MESDPKNAPDALLLIAPGCPHCGNVLEGLAQLVKAGQIGRLEVVNLAHHPEAGRGVRSVPWLRLGEFELSGNRSLGELRQWAERAVQGSGLSLQLGELLGSHELDKVIERMRQRPEEMSELVRLAADPETPMHQRIGVGAVLEEFDGSQALARLVGQLGSMADHPHPAIRADAAHYLGLTRNPEAIAALQQLRQDEDAAVREIAIESLAMLDQSNDASADR